MPLEMSPFGCWGLPAALLALFCCPGSGEGFEVHMYPEQLVVEPGGSNLINCSTSCAQPQTGGLETALTKTLRESGAQWKQYLVSNISQDTVIHCYFTCFGNQKLKSLNISVFLLTVSYLLRSSPSPDTPHPTTNSGAPTEGPPCSPVAPSPHGEKGPWQMCDHHPYAPVHGPWRPPHRAGFSQRLGTKDPPKQVLLKLQPAWVAVGRSFTVECHVPAVKPLEGLTLTLLRGQEALCNKTFARGDSGTRGATATHNSTAHREDGHHNFSCHARLDLRSLGGGIVHRVSEPQMLKVYEPRPDNQMVVIISVVSVLLFLFVTSILLCFVLGQHWRQRRMGAYGVQDA
ncbi:intercellular adhesion molecule 2 isoform X2 [Leptonychotes weddellii]|nr:intercellular adhesion molecule 2 isoform X2 [Leptonychotes weddellii]